MKYKALLRGLEATELPISRLNSELRYEAEYFRKRYLQEAKALQQWDPIPLGSFTSVTDGPHGYHVVDENSDVVMLTAKNAKDWFTDREGADHIARHVHEANIRSSLEEDDIVLSTRGTVGCCALVIAEVLPANLDQDVARISGLGSSKFLPAFVATYLNSTFGQDWIHREASGMVQQGLSLSKVRSIPVPCLSPGFQIKINGLVREALKQRRLVAACLSDAEKILLRAIGMENWQPPEPLTYTRSASDVLGAGRFDAAYFSPAKVAALSALNRKDAKPLASFVSAVREMVGPEISAGRSVLNFDVGAASFPVIDDQTSTMEDFDSAKKSMKPGDVVISRLRHYLRQIAVVRTPPDKTAVGSSEFIVLRGSDDALPLEALVLFLRTPVVQTILEYSQDGSQHPRFGDDALLNIPIPAQLLAIAPDLVTAVRSAHAARRQAQKLLAKAQRAVEIAIEESEAAALRFLNA